MIEPKYWLRTGGFFLGGIGVAANSNGRRRVGCCNTSSRQAPFTLAIFTAVEVPTAFRSFVDEIRVTAVAVDPKFIEKFLAREL